MQWTDIYPHSDSGAQREHTGQRWAYADLLLSKQSQTFNWKDITLNFIIYSNIKNNDNNKSKMNNFLYIPAVLQSDLQLNKEYKGK